MSNELNTAAQILLTPEGDGGMREEARGYFDSLMQIVGWLRDAQRIPKPRDAIGLDDIDDDEIEAAAYFIDRLATLTPKTSVPGNDAGMREADWAGASLSVRLRSYPAAPPGEDAFGVDYACRLMAEAAAAINLLTPGVGSLSPPTGSAGDDETGVREASEQMVMAAYDHWRQAKPPGLFAGPKAEIEWMEGIINAALSVRASNPDGAHVNAPRPAGNNADEWNAWLDEHRGYGTAYIAVQIAQALDDVALAPQPPKAETPAGVAGGVPVSPLLASCMPPLPDGLVYVRTPDDKFTVQQKPLSAHYTMTTDLAPAARAGDEVETFIREIERIAGDYIPDRDQDALLALSEMREALQAALTAAPAANGEGA